MLLRASAAAAATAATRSCSCGRSRAKKLRVVRRRLRICLFSARAPLRRGNRRLFVSGAFATNKQKTNLRATCSAPKHAHTFVYLKKRQRRHSKAAPRKLSLSLFVLVCSRRSAFLALARPFALADVKMLARSISDRRECKHRSRRRTRATVADKGSTTVSAHVSERV